MPLFIGVLIFVLGVAHVVYAEELTLAYGVNEVDINGDGVDDLIVKSRWENFNAHSFDKYLVMVHLTDEYYPQRYYEVPLGSGYKYSFTTSEGADCDLAGYKFELIAGKLVVTQYKREYGESYIDKNPITITRYVLTDSIAESGITDIGVPPFYLKGVSENVTKQAYCSVRELMN